MSQRPHERAAELHNLAAHAHAGRGPLPTAHKIT
jgi:hypothetical protein